MFRGRSRWCAPVDRACSACPSVSRCATLAPLHAASKTLNPHLDLSIRLASRGKPAPSLRCNCGTTFSMQQRPASRESKRCSSPMYIKETESRFYHLRPRPCCSHRHAEAHHDGDMVGAAVPTARRHIPHAALRLIPLPLPSRLPGAAQLCSFVF